MAKGIKTGGREKGTPNQITKELRTVLKDVLSMELQNLSDNLNLLEPIDRLEILVKLLPYAIPKVEPISHENEEDSPEAIEVTLNI
jgi:hypothetical protein